MQRILMDALCLECYSDLLLEERANIETIIEGMIGLILLDFLGEGIVIDGIKVICTPATTRPSQYWLHMQATSANAAIDIQADLLEARLEEAICCALLEHFHTVVINSIDTIYHEVC
ncbi:MAG TPA: hypothetical protein VF458_02915 [Ktedonobacteraceae bacterium]